MHESSPRFPPSFRRGIELFNEGQYWEAHEAWEEIWLLEEADVRPFLQGLIQLAAAWHHVERRNFRGAKRLFGAALAKLEPYAPAYGGVQRGEAVVQAAALAARLEREPEGVEVAERPYLPIDRGE
ncbi:MAG TPA: DUF309 domain-containing protein [Thermoanaerobaculia bacterium]|nr:DUF309 domain-containing protein [Thermoanaerobaculia bacterium]